MIEYLLNFLPDFYLRIQSHYSLKGRKMNICDHLLLLISSLRKKILDYFPQSLLLNLYDNFRSMIALTAEGFIIISFWMKEHNIYYWNI